MNPSPHRVVRPAKQNGYALIFLLALITMGVMYAVVTSLSQSQQITSSVSTTGDLLKQAKEALLAYAVTYPENHTNQVFGYLPCPDMDGDGSADASSSDCGSNDGQAVIGLLPYKELGLMGNIDAEGNCLWYAVSGTFKASTTKPTPMNWDTLGQFDIRDASNTRQTFPGDTYGGGAAVIFSVGPPLNYQSRASVSASAPCGVSSTSKASSIYANYVDVDSTKSDPALSEPFPGVANSTVRIVAGTIKTTDKTLKNNDQLTWITAKDIWDRVRKRTDIASSLDQNINSAIDYVQSQLTNHLSNYAEGTNYALPSISVTAGSAIANFYANFSDHFRFRKCAVANSYCFVVNGTSCDGILLFGGMADAVNNDTTSPRPSTKRNNTNYFESSAGGGLPLLTVSNPTSSTPAYVTNAAQTYQSTNPSTDIVQCLTPQPPIQITTAQMFSASNTAVVSAAPLVTTNGTTQLTLGTTNPPSNSSLLYGCFWYPTSIPFGTGLRIYYQYVTNARGDGYTFALADADPARNPSTTMCGNYQDALGYAGNNTATSVINYPKMALEFDFRRSNTGSSPAPLFNRNDPTTAPSMHFAFDYWGVSSGDPNGNDDVTHGAGDGVNDPRNPTTSPGLRQFSTSISNGANVYVRIDIIRSYNSTLLTGTYTLNAYLVRADSSNNFPNSGTSSTITCGSGTSLSQTVMSDTTSDLATQCPLLQTTSSSYLRYLTDTITINDISGLSEAMRRVYLGFTTSQQASATQQINLTNFSAATR
ncbi:MAG: hypothetical protein EKK46_07050 [Rhodocyclaceae bacterium]|nr:MAG: hypothetical protein EKK46_07050 [Rhodocyclaceae bacterium]